MKRFGGHEVYPNDILARQRGWFWRPGNNTYTGKDQTIHAKKEGKYLLFGDEKFFINLLNMIIF